MWGKLGVAVEGSFFDTDGFPIVIESERRPSDVNPGPGVDTKAAVNFRNVNVEARLHADEPDQRVLSRRVLQRRARQRQGQHHRRDAGGQRHALDVCQRRRARSVARSERPAGARLHRHRDVPQQLPRRAGAAAGARCAQRRPDDAQSARADRTASAGWRSGRARSVPRNYFTAGGDFRWVDGDSEEDALDAVRGQTVTLQRVSGGTQRSVSALCAGRVHADRQAGADAERACRSLAQLRRAQP